MSTLLFIIATVIALLTTYCSSQGSNNDPAYAPEINPHPKYFMTVEGYIAPTLSRKISLNILPQYQANNPHCTYTINSLEGIDAPVYRNLTFTAKPNSQGNYQVKVPIDYYKPGMCQWSLQSIDYLIKGAEYSSRGIADFTDSMVSDKRIATSVTTEILCSKRLMCDWREVEFYGADLPINRDYTYNLNIRSD